MEPVWAAHYRGTSAAARPLPSPPIPSLTPPPLLYTDALMPRQCAGVCARVCLSEGWIKERGGKKTANRRAILNCAHWDDLKIITFQLASLRNLLCVKHIKRLLFLLCRLNLIEREVRACRVSLNENHCSYYSFPSTPICTTWSKQSCSMEFYRQQRQDTTRRSQTTSGDLFGKGVVLFCSLFFRSFLCSFNFWFAFLFSWFH